VKVSLIAATAALFAMVSAIVDPTTGSLAAEQRTNSSVRDPAAPVPGAAKCISGNGTTVETCRIEALIGAPRDKELFAPWRFDPK
jgi:hypothetical protein